MLERYFPNLYGWLVWGGGLHKIIFMLKIIVLFVIPITSIFLLGFFIGRFW